MFTINVQALVDALPVLGLGLGGVFVVIGFIYLSIAVFRFFPAKKEEQGE